MSWEQDISQKLTELEGAAVRFDVTQNLTRTQKNTAKLNIGFSGASATQIEDQDYEVIFT